MPALAASAKRQSLARRAPVLPATRLAVWELPGFPAKYLTRVGRSPIQVLHADRGDACQRSALGLIAP